jgi:hypothetical protein
MCVCGQLLSAIIRYVVLSYLSLALTEDYVLQCPLLDMTSLSDSRIHNCRVRILSRKAQESTTHDEEPPRRRVPDFLLSLRTRSMITMTL